MHKSFSFGGLTVSVVANRSRVGVGFALGGGAWKRAASMLRGPHVGAVPPPAPATAVGSRGAPPDAIGESQDLVQAVRSIRWYHTIELGRGVRTEGLFDHGSILGRYRLPESLAGMRVLDVATYDGFWAFEFERRGAREVVAVDVPGPAELDLPPRMRAGAATEQLAVTYGRGFELARRALGSRVRRVACSVYDLGPDALGMFDFVHVGDLLSHLQSPVDALQRVAQVCSGRALISEVYFPHLDVVPGEPLLEYGGAHRDLTWWKMGLGALEQMIRDAGFGKVELLARFRYGPRGRPETAHHAVFRADK